MLFRKETWAGLADGTVTVAFRRWKRPTVRAGGTLRTPGGLLAVDEVRRIDPDEVDEEDARAAGHASREEALASLRAEGDLYRVRFHPAGTDPREVLRAETEIAPAVAERLLRSLRRLDWAVPALRLIADHPGTVSTELAARMGLERQPFKQRVRRLKALGLTESLDVGYRLSPRGQAVVRMLGAGDPPELDAADSGC